MDKKLIVKIVTPYGNYLKTEADYLELTTGLGVIGILPNHAPIITNILTCKLTIKNGQQKLFYAVSGGLLNIKEDHTVTILANAIESKDEIDLKRAQAAKERAESYLEKDDTDVTRAKAALARALNRISLFED